MPNKVKYEWSIETVNRYGDIINSEFFDLFPYDVAVAKNQRLCLVRNEGNDIEGLTNRLWAYVTDGKLPDYFEGSDGNTTSYKVPLKFKLKP